MAFSSRFDIDETYLYAHLVAAGMEQKLLTISIYDAGASYHITPKQDENVMNSLSRSSVSSSEMHTGIYPLNFLTSPLPRIII